MVVPWPAGSRAAVGDGGVDDYGADGWNAGGVVVADGGDGGGIAAVEGELDVVAKSVAVDGYHLADVVITVSECSMTGLCAVEIPSACPDGPGANVLNDGLQSDPDQHPSVRTATVKWAKTELDLSSVEPVEP